MSLARLFASRFGRLPLPSIAVDGDVVGRALDRSQRAFPRSHERQGRISLQWVILLMLCFGTQCGFAVSAVAQTAYFGGATSTLGSGFSPPEGVAVDAHGNVYLADTFNGVVREIMAVNGSIPASPTINTVGSGFSYPKVLRWTRAVTSLSLTLETVR